MGRHIDKLVFLGLSGLLRWPDLSALYKQVGGQFSLLLDGTLPPTTRLASDLARKKESILAGGNRYIDYLANHANGAVTLLFDTDVGYPSALKKAPALSPNWVFVQGDTDLFNEDIVAVVGTRKPTLEGIDVARKVATALIANELTILSGLAQGIDATAHKTAINAAYKRCIGVIGSGIDQLSHNQAALYSQILRNGGLIISEYPPHYHVARHQLVARNRIQAMLSQVMIVIEAMLASGTAHTVRYANQAITPICGITKKGVAPIAEHELLATIPNLFTLAQRDLIRAFLSKYVTLKN